MAMWLVGFSSMGCHGNTLTHLVQAVTDVSKDTYGRYMADAWR